MDFYDEYLRPDRRSAKSRSNAKANRLGCAAERERQFGDFTCRHCQRPVSTEPGRSGVNNRNHCPYCLWSKHVDLRESGDRLAACKGSMPPVGLTFKQIRKRYAGDQPGELLIVHQCAACGALSINRVAADDGAVTLWDVFEASLALPAALTAAALADGIDVLGPAARAVVQERVFGKGEGPFQVRR